MLSGPKVLPQAIGVAAALPFYGFSFWRIARQNKGNKTIECGIIAIAVIFGMAFLSKLVDLPDWAIGALCLLLVVLCFATLGFFVQGLIHSSRHRKAGRAAGQSSTH